MAFTPLRLGPLTLRNRFIKSGANEGMSRDGLPTRALVEHHRAIAAGGAALCTVAYGAISPAGRTFADQLCLHDEAVAPLRVLTDAVHREGAAASLQITHGGAFSFLRPADGRRPGSASGGFNPTGALHGTPFKRPLAEAELEALADGFAVAARLAGEAGFDAVEIHMGHGYLLSQFLSPGENRRRDRFGGDMAGRARFPRLVLQRVLDAVGGRMAVLCKIGVFEGYRGGNGIADVVALARLLEGDGAHLLVLSGGMNVQAPWWIFGSKMPVAEMKAAEPNRLARLALSALALMQPRRLDFRELYFREPSRAVRAATRLPLGYLGGVTSMAGVRTALADGFDAVVLGRALLHDPDLVRRFQAGLPSSGCTACNRCVATMHTPAGTHCVLHGTPDAAPNRIVAGRNG
ncbi:2,4-dienoyl-CoA reductase-like NADH-dependent reductase (Old Yellow Enzyme family) [Zavarzinia compransoris]|nr:2,4-dienoyl-CoA reductase-like NADH-dependent reductase (Old Yellow Enzyme family) [Zavarzinia compransoris]